MKLNSKKKFFFFSVFVTFLISLVIFLATIKNNLRLFNNNFLNNYNNHFINNLKKINLKNYVNFKNLENKLKILNENDSPSNLDKSDFSELLFVERLLPINIEFEEIDKINNNYTNKIKSDFQLVVKLENKKNISSNNTKIIFKKKIDTFEDGLNTLKLLQDSFSIYELNSNFTQIFKHKEINTDSGENKQHENQITSKKNPISILESNLTVKGSYEAIDQSLLIFKHINFIYLENKDLQSHILKEKRIHILKILKRLNEDNFINMKNKLKFYLKIAYLNNNHKNTIQNYAELYGDLNKYNSKYILDELFDEKYLNVIIAENKSAENEEGKDFEIIYNKDIKNHIFCINFDSFISRNKNFSEKNIIDLFKNLIYFKTIKKDEILQELLNNYKLENLLDFIKLENSPEIKFYKMITNILHNLGKINKIFTNYDSSRNAEMIKQKVIY